MNKKTVKIATDFGNFLINRDEDQGDGKKTGISFREKFLKSAETESWWKDSNDIIILDFTGVEILGPSWANEVFAYFTQFVSSPDDVLKRIELTGISDVKKALILRELKTGHSV